MSISQRRLFTQDEIDDIIKLYQAGRSSVDLSKKYGYFVGGITRILKDNGIWIRDSRVFTDEQEAIIGKQYIDGISTRKLATMYGVDKIAIAGTLRRQRIEQRSPAERNRLYAVNPNMFDVIDTEEKAYWLGFLWADGNVNRDKTVIIGLKRADEDCLVKFKKFMLSEHPITQRVIKLKGKEYLASYISMTDRHLASRLIELGITKKRPSVEQLRKDIPYHLEHHFFRGLFDGDGCIYFAMKSFHAPSLTICGNYILIEYLWDILDGHNVLAGKRTNSPHITANIRYLHKSGVNCVQSIVDFMYQEATVYMERKHNKAMQIDPLPPRHRNDKGQYC